MRWARKVIAATVLVAYAWTVGAVSPAGATTAQGRSAAPSARSAVAPPVAQLDSVSKVVQSANPNVLSQPVVSLDTTSLSFGYQRVGTYYQAQTITVTNSTTVALTVTAIDTSGADPFDFVGGTTCTTAVTQGSCQISLYFLPTAANNRSATLSIYDNAPDSPQQVSLTGIGTEGYYLATARGQVFAGGDAQLYGDVSSVNLSAPILSVTTTTNGDGYWLLGRDGGIFSFGNAAFHGSTGGLPLVRPVVGMARTPDGGGYWLVASDGGIFSFGNAHFYGSTGGVNLTRPIVGMASTPDGGGYWLVASDGGIFSFGDASFYGSTGGVPLTRPIVGMASTPDGGGYWLVASDGGVFSFGDARFYGSTGGVALTSPIVGMAATSDGGGYWMTAADGGVFTFGDAQFYGSLGGSGMNDVLGLAATTPPLYFAPSNQVYTKSLAARIPLQPPPSTRYGPGRS
ncbi:MAG: choice-of-anchor D domain-containing protein [Acidobacteriota bacterium]|nr:choice-of-anchor D domain-containing protein [Acidobacteriota bacterium]